jgi:hypothetical protein
VRAHPLVIVHVCTPLLVFVFSEQTVQLCACCFVWCFDAVPRYASLAVACGLAPCARLCSARNCSLGFILNCVCCFWLRSPLCLPETSGDYFFSDGQGHNYYANVCGNANKICLPQSWLATYETGVSIQMWGSTPPCDRRNPATLKCLEKSTQLPTCCTANCQVLGVMNDAYPPQFSLVVPSDPNGGVKATFVGAPPDDDDPFWCPFDPATGLQYNRTVSMIFACDESITGDAVPLLAVQNSSESCE